MKKFLKIAGIVLLSLVLIWLFGRYGWKVFGFHACGGSGIEEVSVEENQVKISGFYPGSFPEGCVGCITKEKDGKLYIGVRYDALFGFFELGKFDITVPTREEIKEVYLKSSSDEYLIWSKEAETTDE